MRKIIAAIIFSFAVFSAYSQPSPDISYLVPDIGAPAMATYVEIISDFNPDNPMESENVFGTDGFKSNNEGSPFRVRCVRAEDSEKITIGPCFVSWGGRMISTVIFVNPDVEPNSSDWEQLDAEFRIPIVVEPSPGKTGRIDTFYIVKPWDITNLSGNPQSIIGASGLGKRSRRGAMIVDSLFLGNTTYRVSTQDCDPETEGNQGYLPFVLLSKNKIETSPNSAIDVSGEETTSGHGGHGGPGGGGGGGRFCDVTHSGDDGGNGFVGGGKGGKNSSGVPLVDDEYEDNGEGTGADGGSLNGIYAPRTFGSYEASGGGTGHPFGMPGRGTNDGYNDIPEGGYGGGSGFQQQREGGAGGYATDGENSRPSGSDVAVNGGKSHGNVMCAPLAGGSGGASGNPQSMNECSGSGGGGGGAIKLYAPAMESIMLKSNGADGHNGTSNEWRTRGGAGSGGFVGIYCKTPINEFTLQARGGEDHSGDPDGGAGRMRYDVFDWNVINADVPQNASHFRGPITDTSSFVKRELTLTGARTDGASLFIYMKPESGDWQRVQGIDYNGDKWSLDMDLTGSFCSDSLFYLVALQQEQNAGGNVPDRNYVPELVFSQAAWNILKIIPDIQGDTAATFTSLACPGIEPDSATVVIENNGGPTLNLDIENSYFDAPANGLDYDGFRLISPDPAITNLLPLGSCESTSLTIEYNWQPGHSGVVNSTLFIPHNDEDRERNNPWEIDFTVRVDTFALVSLDSARIELNQSNLLDLGEVCVNETASKTFTIQNNSTIDVNILPFEFIGGDASQFSGAPVSFSLRQGSETSAIINFSGGDEIREYATRVYVKPSECETIVDSFDVTIDVVEPDLIFSRNNIAIDTLNFDSLKVGQTKTMDVVVTNSGGSDAYIQDMPTIIPAGQQNFKVIDANPDLPYLLDRKDDSQIVFTIEYSPSNEGNHSATLTLNSLENPAPKACSGSEDLILVGEGKVSKITAYPIDFGIVPNCSPRVKDTIIVKNKGAEITVTSSGEIIGPGSPNFYIDTSPVAPYSLGDGDSSLYIIGFNPFIPPTGTKSATFHLETDDPQNPDVYASIQGETDELHLSVNPSLLLYGGVPVPQTKSKDFVVTNGGVFDAVIESIEIDDLLVSVTPNANNRPIAGGESQTFTASVNFSEFRSVDATIRIIVSAPCDDTLLVEARGKGLEGEYEYPLNLDFGSLAFCEDTTRTFYVNNLGDPVIEIREMRLLKQGDWQLFTLLGNDPTNYPLNNGDSYERDIRFEPANTTESNKSAILETVVFVNAQEDTLLTNLIGERSSGVLAMPNEVNFGGVIITNTETRELLLINVGERPVTINSIKPLPSYPGIFSVEPPQLNVPKTLNVGDTMKFETDFTPQDVMTYIDTLKFGITAPCVEEKVVILRGEGLPAASAKVWAPKVKVHPKTRNYKIPIYMSFDDEGEDISDISFEARLSFDASLFYPKEIEDGALTGNYLDSRNPAKRVIEFSADNLRINDSDTTLCRIVGDVLLGDIETTPLTLDTFYLTMPNPTILPYVENGELTIKICKEGQPRLLKPGQTVNLLVNPNPATDKIYIKAEVIEVGEHKLELVNLQGLRKEIDSWKVKLKGSREFDFKLDASEFSTGVYYIILRTPTSVKAKPIFIVK